MQRFLFILLSYSKSTLLHNDINYNHVTNIFSGTVTLSLTSLISSLGVSVGDGGRGRGEKTPIFDVWVALVLPLHRGSPSEIIRWLYDPNGDTIEESSV